MPVYSMVAADLTKLISWGPVRVRTIYGWNNQVADVYIQLHQNLTVASGAVPAFKSFLAQAGNGFFYNVDLELTDLIVGLSTTEVNYTAVSAAGGLDMTLVVDGAFLCDGTETIAGDLTTGQNTLQVWAESASSPNSARKSLLRVDVKNNSASDVLYSPIYAVDTVAVTSKITTYGACPVSATTKFFFGDKDGGFAPNQKDKDGTQHYGCTINITALTSGVVVAGSLYGGTSPNIRAIYK